MHGNYRIPRRFPRSDMTTVSPALLRKIVLWEKRPGLHSNLLSSSMLTLAS
jgi:hypothetical protein